MQIPGPKVNIKQPSRTGRQVKAGLKMQNKASWLQRLLGRSGGRQQSPAEKLYYRLLKLSRQPEFYTKGGVPDSFDGRFDMLCLITMLVMRRLRQLDGAGDLSQQLFDALFADMDLTLREMGLGDLGVGKRVRTMSEAFMGRLKAYDSALQEKDNKGLQEALQRNLYRGQSSQPEAVEAMAGLVRHLDSQLAAMDLAAMELAAKELENSGKPSELETRLSSSQFFASTPPNQKKTNQKAGA
jgi:cytochrome b pre-mRNA-processing protein 3